jgi:hypothetical protein
MKHNANSAYNGTKTNYNITIYIHSNYPKLNMLVLIVVIQFAQIFNEMSLTLSIGTQGNANCIDWL